MPRAVRFDHYGGLEVLQVVEVPRPVPGPGPERDSGRPAVHLLPSPPAPDISIFDLRHSAELIERGYTTASHWLDDTGLGGPVTATGAGPA